MLYAATAYRDSEFQVLRVIPLCLVQLLHHMGPQPLRLVVCHLLLYGFTPHHAVYGALSPVHRKQPRIFYDAALDTLMIFITKTPGVFLYCGIIILITMSVDPQNAKNIH